MRGRTFFPNNSSAHHPVDITGAGVLSQPWGKSTLTGKAPYKSGVNPTSLGFGSAFFRLQHIYGAGILFALAVALLGGSLFRFSQEVRIGLNEGDHYR